MADKSIYKIFALIFAIFVYLFLIYIIISIILHSKKVKKDYGYNVKDAIVVDIDSLVKDEPKPLEKLSPKPVQKPTIKKLPQPVIESQIEPQPVVEPPKPKPIILPPDPEPVVEPEKKPDIKPEVKPEVKEVEVKEDSRDIQAKSAKDLFSTLRVDDYKKAMRDHQKQLEARASRLKKQEAKRARQRARKKAEALRKRRAAQSAKELVQQMQISTPASHKKSGKEDEFWSFVSSKIMSKWQRTISTQDGLSATVIIRIDNHGRLTYRDLKSSYNSLFDTKLKVFLDNLEYVRFPSYKNGPYIEAEFEFTDKEKDL